MKPYFADDSVTLWHGEALDVLRAMPAASVDSVCTDPPYGLEFMGREWDSFRPSSAKLRTRVDGRTNPVDGKSVTTTPEAYVAGYPFQDWCQQWAAECLRVLKPGGHLLAFGGTRTVHRLTCGIEDAGFEIRDGIDWLYGQGFPKSLDVSKAIDKARNDGQAIRRVTAYVAEARRRSGVSHKTIDDAFGTVRMANHWMTQGKPACVPSVEQWERLRELLGFGHEMDAEVWRLNGRKGTPGEAWSQREVVGERLTGLGAGRGDVAYIGDSDNRDLTAPATDEARRWSGWGTALKPAREPIVVARKPLAGTVAANVLAHGTGALNIDACRIPAGRPDGRSRERVGEATRHTVRADDSRDFHLTPGPRGGDAAGRWPANVVLTHAATPEGVDLCGAECVLGCPVAEVDRQSGSRPSGGSPGGVATNAGMRGNAFLRVRPELPADSGGASRYFPTFRYEAKADAAERPRTADGVAHPTVKPLALMRWLVRLVTPPAGTVLDPFAGSGTTAEACVVEGFRCIAVEREADYLPLIVSRLSKPLQPALDIFGEVS